MYVLVIDYKIVIFAYLPEPSVTLAAAWAPDLAGAGWGDAGAALLERVGRMRLYR